MRPTLHAQVPDWWIGRGLISTNLAPDDFAPANQGQLKHAAWVAAEELEAALPGGAGTEILSMVAAWTNDTSRADDYAPANQGQLKAVVAPFYDRIIADGGWTNGYPWTTNTISDDEDFAPANLGQLKYAFAFDVASATPEVCPGCVPNDCDCPGCSGECGCGCSDCQPPPVCPGCETYSCTCAGCSGGCCNCTLCGGGDDDDDDDDDDDVGCPGCEAWCDCTGCTGGCCDCGICQPDPQKCPGCEEWCNCPGNCENDCCSCSLPGCQYSPPQTCPGCEARECQFECEGCGGECGCGCDLCVTIEMVTPAGDPSNPGVDSGDGQNEFTFSEEPEGKLTMNLKARVTPPGKAADIAAQCHFTVGAIGPPPPAGTTTMEWATGNEGGKPSAQGDYLVATVTFTGLPLHNGDFGKKQAAIYQGSGKRDEEEYEVFFPKGSLDQPACNHSGEDAGTTANWFYYWKDGGVCGITAETQYGQDPDDKGEFIEPDEIWLYRLAAGEGRKKTFQHKFTGATLDGSRDAKGIHAVASTMRHELTHKANYEALQAAKNANPREGETGRGVDLDGDGVAGSPIDTPPLGVYYDGPETQGGVETLTKTPQGQLEPDTYNVFVTMQWPPYQAIGDDEIRAFASQQSGTIVYHATNDWANPGCQSKEKYGPDP